ncbi:MAG: type II secretion system F family protein [Phycisphaera sp.]|nr:type II secretion system F family protein [Phycisphaera sp.]
MGAYRYTAFDTAGKRVRGSLESASARTAALELERKGLTPIQVDEQAAVQRRTGVRLPVRKLAMTYQQLSDLQRAGVPLLRALRIVGKQKSSPKIAGVFDQLADEVADGVELSTAMGNRPDTFASAHVALIRAGEKAGILESVLSRLSSMLAAQAELRAKVMGSLIYPSVLAGFGVLILIVVFTAFVPRFRPLFARLEGDLPPLTGFVFFVSDLMGRYIGATVVGVVVVGVGIAMLRRQEKVRQWAAETQLKLPVVGRLVKTLSAARFCRLLGTLLDNGVPMIGAMQIARQAAGHPVMARAIDVAIESVRGGGSITDPMSESGLFDQDVVEMIAVAETANNLGEVLVTIAETIDKRVDRLLTTSVRLLEPLLLVLIAVAVVVVAAALLLPMAELSSGL